jgi:hypothetical protein
MTETEWAECTDAIRMLWFLLKTATARKVRHFACVWCRYAFGDAPPAEIPILSFDVVMKMESAATKRPIWRPIATSAGVGVYYR